MKTIIHAVRPVFTWDLLCLARLVVIAWPTLSKKEATPRRTKGMRSQCWIHLNVGLMISSSVYIQNISLLGNKEQNRFSEGFFLVVLCFDTCGCVKKTVCKNLWLAQTVSRVFFSLFLNCFYIYVLKRLSVKPCGWSKQFLGFSLSFLYVLI